MSSNKEIYKTDCYLSNPPRFERVGVVDGNTDNDITTRSFWEQKVEIAGGFYDPEGKFHFLLNTDYFIPLK